MRVERMLRTVGLIGMSSSVVWIVALIVEYRSGLRPPGDGSVAYEADQTAFFLAQFGFLVVIAGLYRAQAGGDARFGRVAIGIWLIGMVAIVLGQGLGLIGINAVFLLPVAGLGQLIGSVLTSIAVWRARRWRGWRRLAPAIWTACTLFTTIALVGAIPVLTIPAVAPNPRAPSPALEGLTQVAWLVLSLALYIEAGRAPQSALRQAAQPPAIRA